MEVLRAAEVTLLVDVRSWPGSRRHPQFNRDALVPVLAEAAIAYRHLPALGGKRAGGEGASPNAGWAEPGFRAYADHALTPAFHLGLAALLAAAAEHRVAIMCAEANWQHCHRRIITDYLLARGVPVRHLPDASPARMTPGADPRPDGTILYPPAQPTLL